MELEAKVYRDVLKLFTIIVKLIQKRGSLIHPLQINGKWIVNIGSTPNLRYEEQTSTFLVIHPKKKKITEIQKL